jgi:hypothetical protein
MNPDTLSFNIHYFHDLHKLSNLDKISLKYIKVKLHVSIDERTKIRIIHLLFHQGFKLVSETSEELTFKNIRFKKIAFHINFFCIRGTSTAIYDYAHYAEQILHHQSIIVVPNSSLSKNVRIAQKKFENRFQIFYYDSHKHMDEILLKEGCDIFYVIKYGTNDGISTKVVKTCIHCVFDMSQPHGDVYAGVSKQIATKYGKQTFVPHMVMEPNFNSGNLRNYLGIPSNAVVFGYHGGYDSFNIHFAQNVVKKASRLLHRVYFVFVNIPNFDKGNSKIFFLNKIVEKEDKYRFINTCDCCLEAQSLGQSFGLSLADFSVHNKPIITYGGPVLNDNYKRILGNKAMYYTNEQELMHLIHNFKKEDYTGRDLNCYKEYSPDNVMKIFDKVFINPHHPQMFTSSKEL